MSGLRLEPGQEASRSLTLTADHVETFAQLSGDRNPLHFDEEFAAVRLFRMLQHFRLLCTSLCGHLMVHLQNGLAGEPIDMARRVKPPMRPGEYEPLVGFVAVPNMMLVLFMESLGVG